MYQFGDCAHGSSDARPGRHTVGLDPAGAVATRTPGPPTGRV
jgi:hypothetical protein